MWLVEAHIHSEVLVSDGNARTSLDLRLLIVHRHQDDWRPTSRRQMGVSRACVKTWIYAAEVKPAFATGRYVRTGCRPRSTANIPHQAERSAALAPWLEHYSTHRGHSGTWRTPTRQPATNLMTEYS